MSACALVILLFTIFSIVKAPLLSMPSESSDEDEDDHDDEKEIGKKKEELLSIEPAKQPQLFVMGFLQELRISLSNTVGITGMSRSLACRFGSIRGE